MPAAPAIRRQLFVDAYLSCFNATEAAKKAGYSERSAHSAGWNLLRHPEVEAMLEQRLQQSAMLADEVLMRLAEQARGSLDYFLSKDMELDLDAAREGKKLHLIKKVRQKHRAQQLKSGDVVETTETEIELHDVQKALELLGRHHGLFQDKLEVSGDIAVKGYVSISPDDWDDSNGKDDGSVSPASVADGAVEEQE